MSAHSSLACGHPPAARAHAFLASRGTWYRTRKRARDGDFKKHCLTCNGGETLNEEEPSYHTFTCGRFSRILTSTSSATIVVLMHAPITLAIVRFSRHRLSVLYDELEQKVRLDNHPFRVCCVLILFA